jgi:hypothetical protein
MVLFNLKFWGDLNDKTEPFYVSTVIMVSPLLIFLYLESLLYSYDDLVNIGFNEAFESSAETVY